MYGGLKKIKKIVDRILNPYTRLLAWTNVKPTQLTWLSLPTGVLGAALIFQKPLYSFPLILIYFILDFSDGMLARHTGNITEKGDKLDYNIDRLVAVVFLINYWASTGGLLLPIIGLTLIFLFYLEEKNYISRENNKYIDE